MKGAVKTSYRKLYEKASRQLEQAQISEASLDAWYLLSYCFHIDRMHFLMERDREQVFPEEQTAQYMELVEQRSLHVPLQYLTGEQEFMGLPFRVNEHVLIPRQDTELLAESVLELAAGREGLSVLDLCTGSGCIAVSLAVLGGGCFGKITGVDISPEALAVARENGRRMQVEIEWVESDMFQKILPEQADIIVSNPPYIRPEVVDTLMPEVRDHEPRLALEGGGDGLAFYRILAEQAPSVLKAGGYLAVEIGCDQAAAVSALFVENGLQLICVKKDLAGLDRVVIGQNLQESPVTESV